MEKETNLTLYNLFDEIDLDSNTSVDLSNEESIEEITLDDCEVCIDDIDVDISLDAIPEIAFVAEKLIPKLTVMVNRVDVDKGKSKKTFRCKKCRKSYKTQSYFHKHTATCGNQVQSDSGKIIISVHCLPKK